MRIHRVETPYGSSVPVTVKYDHSDCEMCVRGFTLIADLENHLIMHKNQKGSEVHVVHVHPIYGAEVE